MRARGLDRGGAKRRFAPVALLATQHVLTGQPETASNRFKSDMLRAQAMPEMPLPR